MLEKFVGSSHEFSLTRRGFKGTSPLTKSGFVSQKMSPGDFSKTAAMQKGGGICETPPPS